MEQQTMVIYKSKTGFTERYADWICEALNCEKISYEKRKNISFEAYDTVIFGGGFHAGAIDGLQWLKKMLPLWKGKRVVVFATGATPQNAPDVQEALKRNFTEEEWKACHVFYLQSGLCYEKMGLGDKMMMAAFRKIVKKTEGESEAYQMLQHSYDLSSREFIRPLVDFCKEANKERIEDGL